MMNKHKLSVHWFLTCVLLLSTIIVLPVQAGGVPKDSSRAPLVGDGEWTHSGTGDEWAWGQPSDWITACNPGSTEGCWGTNLSGNYQNNCNQNLVSPEIYIPLAATTPISVSWAHAWNIATNDTASASYRCNQAATWTSLWQTGEGSSPDPYWQAAGPFTVTCSAGDTLQFQFNVTEGWGPSTSNGLYVDDVRIYSEAGTYYVENFEPGDAPRYGGSTKTAGSEWFADGDVLTYTLVISNSGPVAGSPTLVDSMPAGATYVSGSAQVQGGGTLTDTATAIEWSGTVASEDSVTITYQVAASDVVSQIVNTAVISDPLIATPVIRRAATPMLLTSLLENFEHDGNLPELWEQDASDTSGKDWLLATTAASGATQDHTTGTGYFAMVDDSGGLGASETSLLTPWLDLSELATPVLTFYSWIGTPAGGPPSTLHVDIYDGTAWQTDIDTFNTSSTDWVQQTITLTAYQTTPVRLRFRVSETFGDTSDVAIDDLSVQNPTAVTLDSLAVRTAWAGWLPLFGGMVLGLYALALTRHFRRKRQA